MHDATSQSGRDGIQGGLRVALRGIKGGIQGDKGWLT